MIATNCEEEQTDELEAVVQSGVEAVLLVALIGADAVEGQRIMSSTIDRIIAQRIRRDVQGMHAYAVQDSRGMVKLDAMENPQRLPPELRQALGQRLAEVPLNRYPAGRVEDLREALRAHAQVPEGCDLMLGNGSDELISLVTMACDRPGASVLAPVPAAA